MQSQTDPERSGLDHEVDDHEPFARASIISLLPRPHPLFIACNTVKQAHVGRTWERSLFSIKSLSPDSRKCVIIW